MNPKNAKLFVSCTSLRLLPWFAIVPTVVVVMKLAGLATTIGMNMMIVNMLLCCIYFVLRSVRLLCWRYLPAPDARSSLEVVELPASAASLRDIALHKGYRFHSSGAFAERGMRKRAALAIAHVGFAALLATGSYDNLMQLNGVVFLGMGDPFPLNKVSSYAFYAKGALTSFDDLRFKLKGVDRILPNAQYPYGATEVRLLTLDDRQIWQGMLPALGKGHREGDFVFRMNSFEYDIWLVMTTTSNHIVYTDWVHFNHLAKNKDGFTHHGTLKKDKLNDVDGTALYDQATDRMLVSIRHGKKKYAIELGEAPNHQKTVDDYVVKVEGIGRWSKMHVMRKRHIPLLATTALIAIAAGVLAFFSPRGRLWIREGSDSVSRVASDDAGLLRELASVKADREDDR